MMQLSLAITTAVSPTLELVQQALALADELSAAYAPRRNVTLAQVFRETGAQRMLIAERYRLLLRDEDGVEYFFHPNLALVRGLNILRGARDLFAEATGLGPGDRLLDCTLGFAAEATLGALLVGDTGTVVGLESVPELAAVTRAGVRQFPLQTRRLREAMGRVHVVTADYRQFLPQCVDGEFDIVYFDPFFEERLPGSVNSISPLAHFGNPAPLAVGSVQEARRVARRRVVVKHPKHQPLPEELASCVAETVTTRKNRIQYDIFTPI